MGCERCSALEACNQLPGIDMIKYQLSRKSSSLLLCSNRIRHYKFINSLNTRTKLLVAAAPATSRTEKDRAPPAPLFCTSCLQTRTWLVKFDKQNVAMYTYNKEHSDAFLCNDVIGIFMIIKKLIPANAILWQVWLQVERKRSQ